MDPAALSIAADLAASLLLVPLILAELVVVVVLFGVWRGLRLARRRLPEYLAAADGELRRVEARARAATDRALRPQIALASGLAGLAAGARALVGLRR